MIFFLVSAHDENKPLSALLDESDAIKKGLSSLEERSIIKYESINRATNEKVNEFFLKKAGEIAIFHYSGHADGQRLHIPGGGHIKGMAGLFGIENDTPGKSAPRLVFLNGCATSGQVAQLHLAGVEGVIATYFNVEDEDAYVFAQSFYAKWAQEGVSLGKAFNYAYEILQTKEKYVSLKFETELRDTGDGFENKEHGTWGLFVNLKLSEEAQSKFNNWQINPKPPIPPLVLNKIEKISSKCLGEVAKAFSQMPGKKKEKSVGAAILELIKELPWVVGTHLRRLFALEPGETAPENNLDRLKDIDLAYTELLRFLNNILVSMLWDQQETLTKIKVSRLPNPIPNQEAAARVDYLSNIRTYLTALKSIPGDQIGLEEKIRAFLDHVDKHKLDDGHKSMAELHLAFYDEDPQRLSEFLEGRGQTLTDLDDICLKSEAIYASFLEASLFLTEYRLLSIWFISVTQVKFVDNQKPYAHTIVPLHGALGKVENTVTSKKQHGDSYCVVMVPAGAEDLEQLLNLSPLYIDKNALVDNKAKTAYPAIFTLQYQQDDNSFVYSYLDYDRNYAYQDTTHQELLIDFWGIKSTDGLESADTDNDLFMEIHKQLIELQKDFAQS
jgi:hypothetical protein